jgi:hypothetical protein
MERKRFYFETHCMTESRLGTQHNCITYTLSLYENRLLEYKQNTEDTWKHINKDNTRRLWEEKSYCSSLFHSPNPLSFYSNSDIVANFENFTSVTFQVWVFWVVTHCGVVVGYQRFGTQHYTALQPWRQLKTDTVHNVLTYRLSSLQITQTHFSLYFLKARCIPPPSSSHNSE